jgi:hypothetical protein
MARVSTKLERETEGKLLEYCEALGILCEKLKKASESGWPDRTLLYKGHVMFMELKKQGEHPTPLQKHVMWELTKRGFDARWSDDLETLKLIVTAWKHYVDDTICEMDKVRRANSGKR